MHDKKANLDINIVCFPFAGGSRYSFSPFQSQLTPHLRLITYELPGRGDRMSEPFLLTIESMVEDLFLQTIKNIREPFIFYGHSMGGLLSYLVARKLSEHNLPLPKILFVSGCEGPSVNKNKIKLRSDLNREDFLRELKILGGVSDEILKDESFVDFFEPILRADLKAIERYEHDIKPPFNIPICAIYGSEEDLSFEEVSSWQQESSVQIDIFRLPGDHFFIFSNPEEVINIVRNKIF